jgi:hypothetical protein
VLCNTTELADAASKYLSHGWQPIDLPLRSKSPNRIGWQDERPNAPELRRHLRGNPRNLSVLTGGLLDVDIDAPEALLPADSFLPETQSVPGRANKHRSHRLRHPPGDSCGEVPRSTPSRSRRPESALQQYIDRFKAETDDNGDQ